MHTVGIIMIGMALGISSIFTYGYISQAIKTRLNNGQKVHFDGKIAGYIVVCRYNGNKKYFFVDEDMNLNTTSHYERSTARKACRQQFIDKITAVNNSRPRSMSFPRA